ncbi:MAG TPA: CehA/McbA family metallohydrolase [Chloroflexota bacterium]|nr:CehA/McbA family metallohydrolase [Chloroflexota bacterium]
MADYTAVSLVEFTNVGLTILNGNGNVPLGSQTLRGLPFEIGSDPARCLVGLGEGLRTEPLVVPIGQAARVIVVAHRLLDSRIQAEGWIGESIAEYVFRYADGAEARVPIRDRFEIATVPTGWGQLPFDALPDRYDRLMPRYEGNFAAAGNRQTEAIQGTARAFHLWTWENPRPDAEVASLTIVPAGPRFVVAGLSLGFVDEHPFVREAARSVRIDLTDPAHAARPFNLEVSVDRGIATYPYPLPAEAPEAFLKDRQPGFGEPLNQQSSPAYVQIAATPSATVTVKSGDEVLGEARWGALATEGQLNTGRVRLEVIDPGRNWVRTRVVDDATGEVLPCRVHFRSPEGVPYQPHGHHEHVFSNLGTWHVDVGGDLRLGQISYAYVDGTCEGWLPRGEVIVDVARGFEYEPLRERVTIAPGQQELTLRLKRWSNLRQAGWYSGDTHVHFLSSQGSQREARGEDLNVVNLLLSQWGHLFTNTEEFTGEPLISRDGKTIVYATQENRQHLLGHLTLLGLKKQVAPWCSDGPSEAELGGALETTLSDWADRCHAQGGTVVLPHLPNPNGEPATLIATGRVDGVEMIQFGRYQTEEYYRYLNCGYRLPIVGGTDKMTSEVPVGLYRTFVRLPADQEFSYDNWCRGLAAGRTFLSGGPLIGITVEGQEVGDTVQLPAAGGTVEVHAWAESIFPISVLEIVQAGEVVARAEAKNGTRRLELRERLPVTGNSWLAARTGGQNGDYFQAIPQRDVWQRGIFAHTSPVYVACGGDWQMFDPRVAQYMLTLIDGSLTYIRKHTLRHPPGQVTHHHGEADHEAYLERPFLEGQAALHRRLHEWGIAH